MCSSDLKPSISYLPKYALVKNALMYQIEKGQYKPGEQLPIERELAQMFDVSYVTMARALSELKDAGIIERRWGHGTFVREVKRSEEHTSELQSH